MPVVRPVVMPVVMPVAAIEAIVKPKRGRPPGPTDDNHMYSTRHSTAFGAPERDETKTSMDEKISDVTVQIQAADARAEKAIAAAAL